MCKSCSSLSVSFVQNKTGLSCSGLIPVHDLFNSKPLSCSGLNCFLNFRIFDVNGIRQQMLNDFLHFRGISRPKCHFNKLDENEQTTNGFNTFFHFLRQLQFELLGCRCKWQMQLYFRHFVPPSKIMLYYHSFFLLVDFLL